MELKTQVHAEDGMQELMITREFDLSLELLFRAFAEPELVEQWMGTRVLKLESRRGGEWQFETADVKGKVVFRAHGVIHEFDPDQKIIRTFEMENASFGVQLETLEFEKLSGHRSRLRMHSVYQSVSLRDAMLKLPFAQGINMAHNRLQEIIGKLKKHL